MRIAHLTIENYRGISKADILLPKHAVLIGDNNTGKTTTLEALDLVLGPDRLRQQPPIDEHDFFRGKYMAAVAAALATEPADAATGAPAAEGAPPTDGTDASQISITVTVADLTDEQKAKFGDYVEFWDSSADTLYGEADPAGVDPAHITEALRVTFQGRYNEEEDDFEGQTYFTRSLAEDESHDFSVTRCDFWTSLSGGTRRDHTTYSASLTFYGTLSTPIRATTVIEAVVYLKDEQSYRSIDEAPAYVNRTTQKPVGWLDLRPEALVVLFLPVPDFDRLWVIAAAGKITDGHIVITPVKWRRAEVRNLSLASKPME